MLNYSWKNARIIGELSLPFTSDLEMLLWDLWMNCHSFAGDNNRRNTINHFIFHVFITYQIFLGVMQIFVLIRMTIDRYPCVSNTWIKDDRKQKLTNTLFVTMMSFTKVFFLIILDHEYNFTKSKFLSGQRMFQSFSSLFSLQSEEIWMSRFLSFFGNSIRFCMKEWNISFTSLDWTTTNYCC